MDNFAEQGRAQPQAHHVKSYILHSFLFLLTFVTTALAGVQWMNMNPFELSNFSTGITYAFLILAMLSSHEFGHYFAARYHGVHTTLPYFLPFPSYFGTLGAVIRLRSAVPSRKVMFDIGAAGPIAGFIVSLVILVIGLINLPPRAYLDAIHPEYAQMLSIPDGGIRFGDTLLYTLLSRSLAPPGAFLPPMNEIYHYPFLCVGWFGMLVTAMNLIPIGQLDGGHITHAMFGNLYHLISRLALAGLIVLGMGGLLRHTDIGVTFGWEGWLVWAAILIVFALVFRLNRPPIEDETALDPGRMAIGWSCILIFVLSFSPTPFSGLS